MVRAGVKRDRGDISSEHQEVNLRWHLFVGCFKAGLSIWKSKEMWGKTVAQIIFLSYCAPKGQFFFMLVSLFYQIAEVTLKTGQIKKNSWTLSTDFFDE